MSESLQVVLAPPKPMDLFKAVFEAPDSSDDDSEPDEAPQGQPQPQQRPPPSLSATKATQLLPGPRPPAPCLPATPHHHGQQQQQQQQMQPPGQLQPYQGRSTNGHAGGVAFSRALIMTGSCVKT